MFMSEKTIYALGFFDGIHQGHQALLLDCKGLAWQKNCQAGVVTFTSHPDTLVHGATPALINTIEDRVRLLKQYGMTRILELPFDRKLMEMPWQEFFRMLREEYGAAGFVCGEDFRFGCGGAGTATLLQEICREEGIPCIVTPQLKINGSAVSSTRIRGLLQEGNLEEANDLLGHPHMLSGNVQKGRQLGRTIGVPTANLRLPEGVVVPKFGVYACTAYIDGRIFPAVTNIGTRPTVGGTNVTVEPWILDFNEDLYDREITLSFHKFLRPEQKFGSLEELKTQIQQDAAETFRLLQ